VAQWSLSQVGGSAAPAAERGGYCDTRSHVALLDTGGNGDPAMVSCHLFSPWGAPLATVGSQALRSRGEDEPHARPTVGMMGLEKGTEALTLRIVTRAELERPFGSRAKTA
jgi:hypothetical protein